MKKLTTAQWVQTQEFSMGQMEEYLVELGYQTLDTSNGRICMKLTEKGKAHAKASRNPFNPGICWDFEAFLECVRLHEKRGKEGTDVEGLDLQVAESEEYKKRLESIENVKCQRCGKEAHNIDEVIVLFGFEKEKDGLRLNRVCKECRGR